MSSSRGQLIGGGVATFSLSEPIDGTALCLSGGGKRATYFHVGALRRLNELGRLRTLRRVSSVSGGSITAAFLALCWNEFNWSNSNVALNFEEVFVKRLLDIANTDLLPKSHVFTAVATRVKDAIADLMPSTLMAFLRRMSHDDPQESDGGGIGHELAKQLEAIPLFEGKTLQHFPEPSDGRNGKLLAPDFYINATSIQTGNLFIFTRRYMGEVGIGYLYNPKIPVSHAITASAAFPPIISPYKLELSASFVAAHGGWHDTTHTDDAIDTATDQLAQLGVQVSPDLLYANFSLSDLATFNFDKFTADRDQLRANLYLGDGGIYDNLGLEVAVRKFRTLLVSDGGVAIDYQKYPIRDFVTNAIRTWLVSDNAVRCLRRQQLFQLQVSPDPKLHRNVLYWCIHGDLMGHSEVEKERVMTLLSKNPRNQQDLAQQFRYANTVELANVDTTLAELPNTKARELVRWGYVRFAVADAIHSGTVVAASSAKVPIVAKL